MNKTGARILGGFAAALISWIWSGWFEPWTGVAMGDAMLTSLGGAMIVIAEWVLVKEPACRQRGRAPAGNLKRGLRGPGRG
jgi:hypothetical protein